MRDIDRLLAVAVGALGPCRRGSYTGFFFPVSLEGAATAEVNFQEMLQAPGPHTLCSWISTYREYGPNSWITLDLVMEGGDDQAGKAHPPCHPSMI